MGSDGASIALQQVTASTVVAIDERLRSNTAAVILDDYVVAVDTGMRPYAARLFRETLERTFRRPVRFACVTHCHADHTFGLTAFKDVTLVASRRLAYDLRRSPDWSPEARAAHKQTEPDGGDWLDEVELVIPSVLFEGQLDITNNGRTIEFRTAPGHTDCSVYGYLPDEKVLLSGDLIFADMFPFGGDASADPETWMATLRWWMTIAIDHVIPGHGPVSGPGEIVRQLEFFEALKENTLDALEAGRGPEDIALPPVYPVGDKVWFVGKTLRRWHEYYGGRS